jgi:hypothetical protein
LQIIDFESEAIDLRLCLIYYPEEQHLPFKQYRLQKFKDDARDVASNKVVDFISIVFKINSVIKKPLAKIDYTVLISIGNLSLVYVKFVYLGSAYESSP